MAKLKKHDINGKELDQLEIDDQLLQGTPSRQMIKDYLVALMNNQRQWSASTKGRKEVKATSKKPHPQKGTGRARQGCIVAAQYRGGGIVFGPKPKPQSVRTRINAKEKRAAIRYLLAEKIKGDQLTVLDTKGLDAPKTKVLAAYLKALELKGKRVLFLSQMGEQSVNLSKSLSNIPKAYTGKARLVNGYDIANSTHIVVTESAIEEFKQVLQEVKHAAA